MSSIQRLPLLCWQLGPELVGGILVGSDLSLVRADSKKLIAAFAEELRREEFSPPPELLEPQLKRLTVSLHPTYSDGKTDFPMPEALDVPVDLVHGRYASGGRVCHLPRLARRFFFDEPTQLDALARYFSRETLRNHSPEALYRYLIAPAPWLESILSRPAREPARRWRAAPPDTPRLEQIAERLPSRRRGGALSSGAWERAAEVDAVVERLTRGKGNLLLVGASGVGKSTLLQEAIRKTSRLQNAPPCWRTNAQRIVSGARYLGDWQQLAEQTAQELAATSGILWVEDFISLMRVGGSGPEDSLAAFWLPLLDRGHLRLLSEITPRGLDAARGLLPSFVARFEQLSLEELGPVPVRRIIGHYAEQAERNLSITVPPRARRLAYRLLQRHVRYERFPGKAARLLSDCIHHAQLNAQTEVDEAAIMERFISRTGMPADLLDDRIPLAPEALHRWFSARIIGQTDAVREVSRVVQAFKAGLNDPDRPLATLLFAGPTGVGKTAMAKTLAGYFFGAGPDEAPLVRIDMSELQSSAQIDRLIGTTSGEPGEIIQKIRQRPFSVVLFDEIEKAAPVFFDILLTVLDEGILADALGRETDFRGSVIILTTNLGTGSGGSLGFSRGGAGHDPSAVQKFFRPEFFNRIDRVVHFAPLGLDAAREITRKELSEIPRREGLRARRLQLSFSDALVDHLVQRGFDPDYGARALQRIIEQQVIAPLGHFLLHHPDLHSAALSLDYTPEDEVRVSTRAAPLAPPTR